MNISSAQEAERCLLLAFEAVYSLSYSTSDFAFLFAPTHSAEFAKFLLKKEYFTNAGGL